jgi:hypothetical protein
MLTPARARAPPSHPTVNPSCAVFHPADARHRALGGAQHIIIEEGSFLGLGKGYITKGSFLGLGKGYITKGSFKFGIS